MKIRKVGMEYLNYGKNGSSIAYSSPRWGEAMYRQYKYGLLTGVLEMPSWLIGLAIPLSAVFSIIRMIQYEAAISKDPEEQAKRKGE